MQLHLLIDAAPTPSPASQPTPVSRAATGATPARKLPELYYLHNFCRALDSLKDRYTALLSAEEQGFIAQFARLPQPSQCLVTRLLMRKGCIFRRSSLAYPEAGDLHSTLRSLAECGWVDTDPVLTIEELSQVLSRVEWRETFGTFANRRLSDDDASQLALPMLAEPSAPRPLSQWHRGLAGKHLRLAIEPVARHLQLLYFGNDYQSWAEFVLTDLGLQRYESVACDSASCAFRNRAEIEHFYRLNECRARARDGEAAASILADCCRPEGVSEWLGARFARLQIHLGDLLCGNDEHDLALRAYRASATVEGRIKSIRLQERQGLLVDARHEAVCAAGLDGNEAGREAVARILNRLHRRLGEAAAPRSPRPKPEVLELELPSATDQQRVEHQACAVLGTSEAPAFYVENSLFPSLLGLLCWDAIFTPLPGAFFHPFQSGPADLYTREFRSRRAGLLEAQLALLESGGYEEVIWRNYRGKAGITSPFVRWRRLQPQLLKLALACIAPLHLKLIFERMLDDLENHCSGLPDLIHFKPREQRYQLIEVKAPGDRLQDNQLRWMAFFSARGIPAAVCKVRWAGASVRDSQSGSDDL